MLAACVAGKGPEEAVFTGGSAPVLDFRDASERVTIAAHETEVQAQEIQSARIQ
jgi:hypothetical protein